MIIGPINSGSATGGAGVATANATTSIDFDGLLMSVYVRYNDSPPATTDVTVASGGTSPNAPALTYLSVSNANTDGWFHPRVLENLNTDGTALTTHAVMPVADKVTVTIAQANDGDSVDVWLVVVK